MEEKKNKIKLRKKNSEKIKKFYRKTKVLEK